MRKEILEPCNTVHSGPGDLLDIMEEKMIELRAYAMKHALLGTLLVRRWLLAEVVCQQPQGQTSMASSLSGPHNVFCNPFDFPEP